MKQGAHKGNQNAKKDRPVNAQLNTRCHVEEMRLTEAAADRVGKSRSRYIIDTVMAENRRVLGIAETVR